MNRKRMPHSYPGIEVVFVDDIGLFEEFSSNVIFLAKEQIKPNCIAGNGMVRVVLLQHTCNLVELSMILLLKQTAAVYRQDFQLERVLFDHLFSQFVSLVNIVFSV